MRQYETECVCCGLPCLYEGCPYYKVEYFICDKCGKEGKLYDYYGEEICAECLLKEFRIVEGSDW